MGERRGCGPLAKGGGEEAEDKSSQQGWGGSDNPTPTRLGIKCVHCVDSSHLAVLMAVEFIGEQLLPLHHVPHTRAAVPNCV